MIDEQDSEKWLRVDRKAGTTTADFINFIQQILGQINPNRYVGARTVMMDNLSSHRSPIVHQIIHQAHHQLLYRPKYSPELGPIEYVFNTLQSELRIRMRDITADNIEEQIQSVVANMNGFENYFAFCGY